MKLCNENYELQITNFYFFYFLTKSKEQKVVLAPNSPPLEGAVSGSRCFCHRLRCAAPTVIHLPSLAGRSGCNARACAIALPKHHQNS